MVCVVGYSTAVRPPVSVTEPIKAAVMHAYGDRGPPSEYELDHLVPLELGGAPRDLRNMWPEPTAAARVKDRREKLKAEWKPSLLKGVEVIEGKVTAFRYDASSCKVP